MHLTLFLLKLEQAESKVAYGGSGVVGSGEGKKGCAQVPYLCDPQSL